MPYPEIDPVLLQIGPLAIRWYSLAYIVGLLAGWRMMLALAKRPPSWIKGEDIGDFLVWAVFGVVIGGRLGHVLFYNSGYYFDNPAEIFKVWQGGMSFHGGILGVTAAGLIFVRRRKIGALKFADLLSCVAPIGLFLGRIANFINGELWGRPSDAPWSMVFPRGGPVARHPSQLYEAALEGLLLLLVLHLLWRRESIRRRPGFLTGVFLAGYGIVRSLAEFTREPDGWVDIFVTHITIGQALSIPMIVLGVILIATAKLDNSCEKKERP